MVNGDIVMLSAQWERRRTALTELQQQLQVLPSFLNELYAITANIGMFFFLFCICPSKHSVGVYIFVCESVSMCVFSALLEGEFEEMESRLVYLETLCSHCDEQAFKQQKVSSLETYRKKKRYDLLFSADILNILLKCSLLQQKILINQNRAVSANIKTSAFEEMTGKCASHLSVIGRSWKH